MKMTSEQFMNEFERHVKREISIQSTDKALYILLKNNYDHWRIHFDNDNGDYYTFHKLFRQSDIIEDCPYLNGVIWHLIGSSEIFWNIINKGPCPF